MKTEFYIDRKRSLSPAQNYEWLRETGLDHIESLAHELWTDYNAHDPGITILEILCYAITELGYRANFNIEDLLTGKDGTIKNDTFFRAKEILTNAPLTRIDYRKLLIDIQGVNNAWIIYNQNIEDDCGYKLPLNNEIPLYINKKEDKLSFSSLDRFGNTLNRLPIRGLNKVVVELGEDLNLGQLNEVSYEYSWLEEERFVEVEIETELESWNDERTQWFKFMSTENTIEIVSTESVDEVLNITVRRKSNILQTFTLKIKPYDRSELDIVINHFNDLKSVSHVINQLFLKRTKVTEIYTEIRKVLYENRNLTEDWLCIDTITNIEIGICADLQIESNADAEQVLVQVEQAIDLILNPPIRFYTLHQMLDKDLNPREIFNGPSLKHGFLLDKEVIKAQLPDCIHASDIIAAIMDIDGIKAIDNVLLTAYDKLGNAIKELSSKSWCLQLNGQQKPVFNLKRSKLLLFRDGIPFIIPEIGAFELSQGIHYLKTENDNYKLQDPKCDFEFPKGVHYQLDEYYSIQNDFPTTYGIGKGELLDTAAELRKGQAKQLKAYLLHFDQHLADFFKQLYHAKELFGLKTIEEDKPILKTYYHQYLKKINGIDKVNFWEEAYTTSYANAIKIDVDQNNRALYEDDTTFYDRRNRFLDHLLARFGESFSDYVFMNYTMQENAKGTAEMTIQESELISDKESFLSQYPEISYNRGLGIDYLQEKAISPEFPWEFENRGGYEKRVAALLGINNIPLSDIVDIVPKDNWTYKTDIGDLKFNLQNIVPLPLEEKWELAHMLMNNVSAYRVLTFTKSFIYFVNKDHKRIAKLNMPFESKIEAEEFIPKLYQALNSFLENFYCLEHILLRPLVNENLTDEDLLSVCLNDDCYSEANNDPYSFKVTMVLPGWLARFRNRYFRRYAENLIRNEAPAHTLIKVCWVGREDMITFQKFYKAWIIAYKKLRLKYCDRRLSQAAKNGYTKALSDLIKQLRELNSIFDEGTLHDCIESELNNPILLNNSSLGTLQNIQP